MKTQRCKLPLDGTMIDVISVLSEGNPGAVRVIIEITEKAGDSSIVRLLDLDDMNIRGPQIWVAFKDHCGEDIESLLFCLESRDENLVNTVNMNSGIAERAVVSGASYEHR